ncbi:MAG TPA: type II toxin-antitoxin system VapC family toxin [Candidatus Saccharimonadales bacterium]|nr:type II toxin-antitoxin system VapC family toxin [Candidatus Saccharimonadales bacterium]
MKYVLDTCTFFWLVDDQSKLSGLARNVLANPQNSLHVPVIVLTELHHLVRRDKIAIHAPEGLDVWFRKGLNQHQAQCEPITLEIAHSAEVLPPIHGDPADRFILATAEVIGARILSPDTLMPKYSGLVIE